MNNIFKKEKGISLIEVLVYSAISFLMFTIIISFTFWLINSNRKVRAIKEVANNAHKIMKVITSEVKESQDIYTPTNNINQLSLKTTRYLPEGEAFSYIDIFLCGTDICFKRESQDPVILNSDNVEITNLSFEEVFTGNVSSVQINLTVSYKNPYNRSELRAVIDLTSTASKRTY